MLTTWQNFLTTQAAGIADGRVTDFGDATGERTASRNGTALVDLSHFSVIEATGDDAQAFLQGQLTNDVTRLAPGSVQLNGYCTPKGRLLATFPMWRQTGNYYMLLPADIAPAIQKRLSMFVLRSKVKLTNASDLTVRLGIAGGEASSALTDAFGSAPPGPGAAAFVDGATIIALTGSRFIALVAADRAVAAWHSLARHSRPADSAVWDWLTIRAGEPVIVAATQEQFVPQMVNFELVGGVDFKKGCYPGQEIVARMQYLGKLKRRMYLAHVVANSATAGSELFSANLEGQAAGMIVNAAPAPDGGFDVLAVIQMESAQNHSVHFGSPDGPALALESLPYQVL